MPKLRINFLKPLIWILLFAVIVAVAMLVWLYTGSLSTAKVKIFQKVPLPMALVNGRPLLMSTFLTRYNVAQLSSNENVNPQLKISIYNQLIKEAVVAQMASQKDISVNRAQIDFEYSALQSQPNFQQSLQNFGFDPNSFKNDVIKPNLLLQHLQIWFNSQPNLNPNAYALANDLITQMNGGQDMAVLAGKNAQNSTDKGLEGDMGFVQITDISPELRESVSELKPGETKIIPGLKGLYLIMLEEQTGNSLHLREIFLPTADFNDWLESQIKNFNIINFLKFN
jgi:hypothetical protein